MILLFQVMLLQIIKFSVYINDLTYFFKIIKIIIIHFIKFHFHFSFPFILHYFVMIN
jgi:hypothetical protein